MKPHFLILSLVCAVAFSCGRESVEKGGDDAKIEINFLTQLSARGAIIADPALLADRGGFNVWAFRHDVKWHSTYPYAIPIPLLDNRKVTGIADGSNVTWSYGTPMDWPENKYISFFAYGPADSAAPNGKDGWDVPIIDFAVNATVQNQVDLLIASPLYDQMGPTYANSRPVNIFLNHVLSRIVFSGVLMNVDDGRVIKVKEIVFKELYYRGSTALTYPVSWSVVETATNSYTLRLSEGNLKDATLSTTGRDISSDNGYLFLMPQKIARDAGKDPTMDVTLEIDGIDVLYSSLVFSPNEWLPGKSYNYQLLVDGNDLKIIMIESDLALVEWTSNLMIQPVSLTNSPDKNIANIKSALSSLAYLHSNPTDLPAENCKYFALYLKNDFNHDLTIDMAPYNDSFHTGETVMFDAKKIIGDWGNDGDGQSPKNYKFEITYDPTRWELGAAMQPDGPDVDGVSGATTTTPKNYIRNKGSVILVKK